MNLLPATSCPHPSDRTALAQLWNDEGTILVSYHRCRDCGAVIWRP